jgi:hypothetical protein
MNYVKNVTELIRDTLALKINLASGNLWTLRVRSSYARKSI